MTFKKQPVAAQLAARMCPEEREAVINRRLAQMTPRVKAEPRTASTVAVILSGSFAVVIALAVLFFPELL